MNESDRLRDDVSVRRIFDAALQKSVNERIAFVNEICGSNSQLRNEVVSLLRASESDQDVLGFLPLVVGQPESEVMTGKRLSHFEIEERLGGGGMGIVYKARDTHLGRVVAIKFLPAFLASYVEWRARFIEEAQTVSNLDHPNIAVVHEIDKTEDDHLYIVMAFYNGTTLKKKISNGPIPPSEVVDYVTQICAGLEYAHRRGVVHRDIKPANIMVTSDGQVHIVDFGLSTVTGSVVSRKGPTVGTVAYMSPEQSNGLPTDLRTDIWSLGVVMYEMLTGRKPFTGDDAMAVFTAIRSKALDPTCLSRSATNLDLSRIVLTALAKRPEDRFQSAAEMSEELRSVGPGKRSRPVGDRRLTADDSGLET